MRSWGLSLISVSTGPNSATYSSCATARSNTWGLPIETDFVSSSTSKRRREGALFSRDVRFDERIRPPVATPASKRKNVGLVGPRQEEYKRFVGAKQHLHLFGRERLAAQAFEVRLGEVIAALHVAQRVGVLQ